MRWYILNAVLAYVYRRREAATTLHAFDTWYSRELALRAKLS